MVLCARIEAELAALSREDATELLEAPDLDEALEFAERIPAVRLGGAVEVRPPVDIPTEDAF